MTTVKASLIIELNASCPHCDEYFDLFEVDNGRLNEEGFLIKEACPNGVWSEQHEEFEVEVDCPACGQSVKIKGIEW